MDRICWSDTFPSSDEMIEIVKKTVQTSWRCTISSDDIALWLSNFVGEVFEVDDEQRLALWLLCNFTYYNEIEVNHLCRLLYKLLLHRIAQNEKIDDAKGLKDELGHTYFSSIGSAGESGGLLLYFFRQEACLTLDRFYFPTDIPQGKENTAIFIDDVTLSGKTGVRFYKETLESKEYKRIYYITLFATKKAVEELEKIGITVIYCTLLDERDRCFSEKSLLFYHYPELRDKAKTMAKHYGKKIEKHNSLGFEDGQLCLGFNYNTPNNTLPIFWSSNEWNPLFRRKVKRYEYKGEYLRFDRFI